MLILSRKIGERIRIGDDTFVVVVSIDGDEVRLGTAAPPNVPIDREEIWLRKKHEAIQKEALKDLP